MGVEQVNFMQDEQQMKDFVWHLLRDIQALEKMLDEEWFETDTIRIGAEQEMCIVNKKTLKPELINMEVLEKGGDAWPWATTELAKFNLETNLSPQVFTGTALGDMQRENEFHLREIQKVLDGFDARTLLTGILPTLRKHDLDISNLTPKPRYFALMQALASQRTEGQFELRLTGIDELLVKHDSALLEACNTSYQVHLQVTPKTFVPLYNIAQMLAAPMVAIAANSPLVFGKRLWHETRIALFQQSLDTRSTHEHLRERSPRVTFGKGWLKNSILEIYQEDISRFRVLLGDKIEEDALKMMDKGQVPNLRALQVHNSTVYRWNRPCYGITTMPDGSKKPHLRIECRVLPAGPTVNDQMANAAFWLGAMIGYHEKYGDITQVIGFDDVRDNFGKAAKFGIDTTFSWINDTKTSVTDLVLGEMSELARLGMQKQGIVETDIDYYINIIRKRAESHMTGARWQLRTFTSLIEKVSPDEALTVMTAAIGKNQDEGSPVHEWGLPGTEALDVYSPEKLKVEEFMQTDLFTCRKEDILELVANMMDWRRIRYMPVENEKGQIIGLVTSRILLRHMAKGLGTKSAGSVEEIMIKEPLTVGPDTNIMHAMTLMREKNFGCLPVVDKGELIGIITEMDFLRVAMRLMERK
jgi:CBS domain-containing protein